MQVQNGIQYELGARDVVLTRQVGVAVVERESKALVYARVM